MVLEEWRISVKRAWHDPFIRWTTISELVFILAGSGFFLWRIVPEGMRSGVLALHYNIYLGVDDVRPWQWIALVPALVLIVYLADMIAAYSLFKKDEIAARALAALALAFSIVWAIGAFFLIIVNL